MDYLNPPAEVLELLNDVDKGVIGITKPHVIRSKENNSHFPGKQYPAYQLEISDGDHLRIDEQGLDDHHE
jgi:hypothetical protein